MLFVSQFEILKKEDYEKVHECFVRTDTGTHFD